jgi:hypothetical protein
MDPAIGYGLLAVGGILLLVLVLRIVRPGGEWKQVKARDVSGQVVVADRVEGGVSQHRVDAQSGPEAEDKGRARKAFDWIDLVLGILVSILTIIGAIVAFGAGP